MEGAYFNGKFVKKVKCWRCGSSFYSNRSCAKFCSENCRLRYYRDTHPKMREIKCEDCGNRSDQYGKCELWKKFNGKTHPRNCKIALEVKE